MNNEILEILQKLEAGVLQEKPIELKEFSNGIKTKVRETGISVRAYCGLCDIDITICHHIKVYKRQRKYNGDESAEFVKIIECIIETHILFRSLILGGSCWGIDTQANH
jgi:hypothetical protein